MSNLRLSTVDFLACGGGLAAEMRARDWSDSPLGHPATWSQALKTTVATMLRAQAQIVLFWGPELVALYNDAYAPTIGGKHPRALGRPAAENWSELWEDLEPLLRGVRETGETFAAKDRPFYIERHGYGETVYFDVSYSVVPEADGTVGGVLCIVAETTERVRAAAQAAERQADALYRAYFANTAEALFVVKVLDDGGFSVEDLNPAHQRDIGFRLADVAGKRIDEILPPAMADLVQSHYRRVIASGEVYQYSESFELRGRKTFWDTVLVPVRDPQGRIVRLIGSSRDLTIQHAAEEQLRQAQKMEAMGQLTGGVAHDFNNLLTPIIASLDMLQRKRIGGDREQRLIAGALQSADRAKTLVQRLLAFARRQPLQPVAVDVAQVVASMAELVARTTGPQIKVAVDVAEHLPAAKADPNQLEMALLNLAVNARDAMPDGGTLRITAAAERVAPGHAKLGPGDYVRLSVVDTGVGMDEETLARAVEPFFSTKGIGKGTGLGLSMAHGLALQLGGALTIESRRGAGTNVELWLPRSDDQPVVDHEAAEATAARSGVGTILLVEDEDLVRMSIADMLVDLGYKVVEANSAEAAFTLIEQGFRPDVLVTDHLMPGMSGTDLARAVRDRQPGTPILVVSGYAESDGIAPDLPRLTKPFRNDDLAACLAQITAPGVGAGAGTH